MIETLIATGKRASAPVWFFDLRNKKRVHWARYIIPQLFTLLTGRVRYLPDIEWSDASWTHNVFRFYEMVCWRSYGKNGVGDTIRAEMSAHFWRGEDGVTHTTYACHSWESVFALTEQYVREFIASLKPRPFKIYIPVMQTPQGFPIFASPYLFAIALDTYHQLDYTGASQNRTDSYTVTGSNPFLVTGSRHQQRNTDSSTTWNGTNMTQSGTQIDLTGSVSQVCAWYLGNPATGTHNMVHNSGSGGGSNEWTVGIASFSGCAATVDANAENYSTASPSSLTATITTVAANAVVWSYIFPDQGGVAASTNVDHTLGTAYGGTYEWMGYSNAIASAGSKSITWTFTAGKCAMHAISIAPVANVTNQTIAAVGVGAAAVATITGHIKTLASTAAGTAAVSKLITASTTVLHAIGVGVGALTKASNYARTLAASGTGVAALTKGITAAITTLQAIGVGVATMTAQKAYLVTLEAIGQGIAALSKTPGKLLASTGDGIATISRVLSMHITMAATGVGISTVTKSVGKTLAAIGQAIATLSETDTEQVVMAAVAAATATLSKVVIYARTLAATAAGTATITKSVGKILSAVGVGVAVITATRGVILQATAQAIAVMTKTPGKLLGVVANVVALMRRDFWRTKYTPQGDDYEVKYPHGD